MCPCAASDRVFDKFAAIKFYTSCRTWSGRKSNIVSLSTVEDRQIKKRKSIHEKNGDAVVGGRASDAEERGPGFDPNTGLRVVYLSKTH